MPILSAAIPSSREATAGQASVAPAVIPARVCASTALRWAAVVSVLMSTQYLVQPFVWAHWPVDEVLTGWIEVVGTRLAVAIPIALALLAAVGAGATRPVTRAALIGAAIVGGAAAGEVGLVAAGAPGARGSASAVLGAVVQWSGVALCVSGMHLLWMRIDAARARELDSTVARTRAEALSVRTELESLRRQIDPHFLFNTLATIRRLKETEAAESAPLLRHLIDYLESAAQGPDPCATLGDEIDLARSHLAIVAIRMTGRLHVEIDVPGDLRACACPPLTLATLVENAVRHGITPSPIGGTVAIRARRVEDAVEIRVEDTGVGLALAKPGHGGAGIGIANTRARLRALYGDRASLTLGAHAPRGVCATVRLPLHVPGERA